MLLNLKLNKYLYRLDIRKLFSSTNNIFNNFSLVELHFVENLYDDYNNIIRTYIVFSSKTKH